MQVFKFIQKICVFIKLIHEVWLSKFTLESRTQWCRFPFYLSERLETQPAFEYTGCWRNLNVFLVFHDTLPTSGLVSTIITSESLTFTGYQRILRLGRHLDIDTKIEDSPGHININFENFSTRF